MRSPNAHAILIANAVLFAIAGALLLLAPASGLWEDGLGLPPPDPGLFAQVAGGTFLVFAVLLWEAPTDPILERHVGRAAAAADLLTALLLALALIGGDLEATNSGKGILWLAVVAFAGLGALQGRYLRV